MKQRPPQPTDVKGVLWLVSVLVLAQAGVLYAVYSDVKALRDIVLQFGQANGAHFRAIESFVKYTTDGVWLNLPRGAGPALGAPNASVEIVEFADFECPACGAIHTQLRNLVASRRGVIRLVFMHRPIESLHRNAVAAALGGICAAAGGWFWEYHDSLYANQAALTDRGADLLFLMVGRTGRDTVAFRQCMTTEETRAALDADLVLGDRLAVLATPTFFINGKRVEGANMELVEAAIGFEARRTSGRLGTR